MLISPELETADIQTLIFSGYPKLEASFHLLWVDDPATARRWLARLPVAYGNEDLEEGVHIAFTCAGLAALGVDSEILGGFSLPFREGMRSEHRKRVLGDVGGNDPAEWLWGRPGVDEPEPSRVPDAILLVYAGEPEFASKGAAKLLSGPAGWRSHPLATPKNLRVEGRKPLKEHFGFDDGISNPHIQGLGGEGMPHNTVAAGEFVLGYPNQLGQIPQSPHVPPGAPGGHVLSKGDLGRNGSYLVVRQLEQRVRSFWEFVVKASGANTPEEATRLAAKMVGRWPNGAPLATWSMDPPPDAAAARSTSDDQFLYAGDPHGHACPIGAHIRRTNPRDAVPLLDAGRSIAISKQRRILRRGRAYGKTIEGWPDPAKIVQSQKDPDTGRGLHFLCFVADLERQYEFVQQTWINSRKFGGLANDADPLLSNPDLPPDMPKASDFTIQREPVNRRIIGLPSFVGVRGSAYFFMPGRRAIKYLSEI